MSALAALGADDPDPTTLSAHIATITTLLDNWRTVGAEHLPHILDGVVGRLLLAAGQPERARARLDTALQLAQDTGMCFYDAELLRLRAHTLNDPDARATGFGAAVDLARRQGADLLNCAPPAMISTCAVSPRALPSPTRPAESPPRARSGIGAHRGPADVVQPATRLAPRRAGRAEEALESLIRHER